MSKPQGCTDLTKSQVTTYQKLKQLTERNEKEKETMAVLQAKIDRFNDPELSATAKKYLIKRYSWSKYNKGSLPTEQKSSYIIKGNELEFDAAEMMSKIDNTSYRRPYDFTYNNYLFGICDIINDKVVIDVKVSWSIHSFLPHHITKLSIKYFWQMQGYMELYNINKAEVRYVLMNTPPHLIEREKAKYTEKYLFGEIDSEKFEEEMGKLDLCYDYSKIPDKRKVITFQINRDELIMSKVFKKIDRCREWIAEFDKIHVSAKKIVISAQDYAIESKNNSAESDTDVTHQIDQE